MAVVKPLAAHASTAELAAGINRLHDCLEEHRAEDRVALSAIDTRLDGLSKALDDRVRTDDQWREVALAHMNATNAALGVRVSPGGEAERTRWTLPPLSLRMVAALGAGVAALIGGAIGALPHIALALHALGG